MIRCVKQVFEVVKLIIKWTFQSIIQTKLERTRKSGSLELREKEFYLRFKAIPEISGEDIGEKIIKILEIFWDQKENTGKI